MEPASRSTPFEHTERIRYDPTFDEADVVLVTHEHGDHANVDAVPGDYPVVRGRGRPGKRVASLSSESGATTIKSRELNGGRIRSLSSPSTAFVSPTWETRGCELEPEQVAMLAGVNVMLAPIGGGFTLEPELVWSLAEQVQPNIFVPCHFKTSAIDLPFITVDEFTEGKENVRQLGGSEDRAQCR